MGRTNSILFPWYKSLINPEGDVALLGFTDNSLFSGDLYDRSLDNWDINSDWVLPKMYDTIICTRCAYFSYRPEEFIIKCHRYLNDDGLLFVDWGLGDHWRFDNYKVGWKKGGEHEYAYGEDNYLWSTVWDEGFLNDDQYQLFQKRILKFGYEDVSKAIYQEVPSVMHLNFVQQHFNVDVNLLSCWEDRPQLYILISGIKRSFLNV